MKENSIRRAVREGRAALGTGLKEFATRGVPWIIESSGFDYCMIDMEHGAFDLETIANFHTEYSPWANDNIIICPSIESLEGLENVDAIAAVEGIDMIAYGHSDLSARLGIHLQLDHPRFKAAVRKIADACNKHGKLARGSAETEAQIEEYYQLGCKVLNLPGTDLSTYHEGLKARAARAHARLKSIGVPTP